MSYTSEEKVEVVSIEPKEEVGEYIVKAKVRKNLLYYSREPSGESVIKKYED